MNDSQALEGRCRRLVAMYPYAFRRDREEEMVTVLMDGSRPGQRWPRPSQALNVYLAARAYVFMQVHDGRGGSPPPTSVSPTR